MEYTNEELKGRIIVLERMNDTRPVPPGTRGMIRFVDAIGQIHVTWENGSTLAVVPGEDEYEILNDK